MTVYGYDRTHEARQRCSVAVAPTCGVGGSLKSFLPPIGGWVPMISCRKLSTRPRRDSLGYSVCL
jgi:hypothetical protein